MYSNQRLQKYNEPCNTAALRTGAKTVVFRKRRGLKSCLLYNLDNAVKGYAICIMLYK